MSFINGLSDQTYADLPMAVKAMEPERLPDSLTIKDFAELYCLDEPEHVKDVMEKAVIKDLIGASKNNLLNCPKKGEKAIVPSYPRVIRMPKKGWLPDDRTPVSVTYETITHDSCGLYCSIHKHEYKRFLSAKNWTIKPVLIKWFGGSEQQPQAESNKSSSWFPIYDLSKKPERRSQYTDRWREETGIDIKEVKPVSKILELLQQHEYKLFNSAQESDEELFKYIKMNEGSEFKGKLWDIEIASFNKDFWFKYAGERGLKRTK
jgi:hypothetical protein